MIEKYKIGDIVTVTITGIQPYGAFAVLPDNSNGLIHISEISNEFVRNVDQFVKVGDNINVKIIDIDNEIKQSKLSLKAIDSKRKRKDRRMTYKSLRRPIKETPKGFSPLKKMLPIWIANYDIKQEDKE